MHLTGYPVEKQDAFTMAQRTCSPSIFNKGRANSAGKGADRLLVDGDSHQEVVGIRDIHKVEGRAVGRDLD